ncbi:Hypothetical protein NTJ_01344 [Nesidiocoris tenuis]|uniref:Uncharacterized protein n=1 Tax=Nesidiocoris tenuis TaxID=355587 RepID=A0ABN7A991_9HEMI|nr:Hypothetical protein NTJ_01344 [Nesidiocoris tenuis]
MVVRSSETEANYLAGRQRGQLLSGIASTGRHLLSRPSRTALFTALSLQPQPQTPRQPANCSHSTVNQSLT